MPKDTTAPFWKHCSLSPSFRADEAGSTGKIQQIMARGRFRITTIMPMMPFLKPRSLTSTMPAISGGRDTIPSLAKIRRKRKAEE